MEEKLSNRSINNLELALIEEVDFVLEGNWDNYIDLTEEKKLEIAQNIIDEENGLWEDLNNIIIERVKNALLDRKKYLLDKEKVCELDKEEKYDLDFLIDIYGE